MNTAVDQCPHCGNDLYNPTATYLYGSPIRTCSRCGGTYIDKRYHEIAVEGVPEQTVTEADKRESRKQALWSLLVAIVSFVLFIVIIGVGYIVYILPVVTVVSFGNMFKALRKSRGKLDRKKKKALEIERQQSQKRMQDPQYAEELRRIGYPFS